LNKNVTIEIYVMFPKKWSTKPSFVVRSITDGESMFVRGDTLQQVWVN